VREKAGRELEKLGDLAVPALREEWKRAEVLENRRRLEALLEKLEREEWSPASLRTLRAIEVLERIGTPGARRLLRRLAEGAPEARLTREARSSLDRLRRPTAAAP
jgi:hypothetical protein